MFSLLMYEGKNREDLINKITEELNCNENELVILEQFTEGKIFKSQKYNLSVITKAEIKKQLKNFFNELGKLMNVTIESEINITEDTEDNIYNINLVTSNNSILIGKEGKTLDAIQCLLRQISQNDLQNKIKINVDISNYKYEQTKKLEKNIKNIAKEVLKTKVDTSLDPMNSYNRRIVHTIVSEFPDLETESVGEGKERHVVIKYVGK